MFWQRKSAHACWRIFGIDVLQVRGTLMPVIAMTREIGSRGTEVAAGVARELGLTIVDSEIIATPVAPGTDARRQTARGADPVSTDRGDQRGRRPLGHHRLGTRWASDARRHGNYGRRGARHGQQSRRRYSRGHRDRKSHHYDAAARASKPALRHGRSSSGGLRNAVAPR